MNPNLQLLRLSFETFQCYPRASSALVAFSRKLNFRPFRYQKVSRKMLSRTASTRLHRRIGAGRIAATPKVRNPWQALKTMASRPEVLFRWVHADELQHHIEQRAQAKFGTEVERAKAKQQMAVSRRTQLAPTSTSGSSLAQLAFSPRRKPRLQAYLLHTGSRRLHQRGAKSQR